MRLLLATLVHSIPVVPLAFGHPFLGIALLLIVSSLYIKDKKLSAMIAALELRHKPPYPPQTAKELKELHAARERWRYLQLPWLADKARRVELKARDGG